MICIYPIKLFSVGGFLEDAQNKPGEKKVHNWEWQTWQDLPYLTCRLLEPWQHGFFTQQFSPRPPEEIAEVFTQATSVYRVKQVHGDRVLTPQEFEQENAEERPAADGLITDSAQQSIWVASADCTPVLIGDRQTGRTAAIHAGWRGTAQRIVPKAIAKFTEAGSQLSDLRIALGPAIAGEVYQVSEDVAVKVGASCFSDLATKTPTEILETLMTLENPPLLPDPEAGKLRLDVRRVNALQLAQLGILPEHIAIAPHCTYQQPDHFFSYRRTHQKQVQWSGIVSF